MKKTFLLIFICSIGYNSFTQEPLLNVIDNFYPANPFNDRFSAFLEKLLTDKYISRRTIRKRTDSSFYFFKGEFIILNPFIFKPSRTEVILAEQEMQFSDSSKLKDTIFVYQLVGYTNQGLKTVENEFQKFQREFGKKFSSSTHSDIMNEGKPEGGTQNYFLNLSPLSPLSVSWGRMNKDEYAIVFTLRFLARQNEALLPAFAANN